MNRFEEDLFRILQESKNKITPFSSSEEDTAQDLQLISEFSKNWDFKEKFQLASEQLKKSEDRLEKVKEEVSQKVTLSLIKEILPVLDAVQQLREHLEKTDSKFKGSATESAIRIIRDNLEKTLLTRDGEVIYPNRGDEFNPEIHCAIAADRVPGYKGNFILEVFRCGYRVLNQIIRPAEVRVRCGVSA